LAMACRRIDGDVKEYLERGTHFIWHILGVLSAHALLTYVYLIDSERDASPLSTRANRE
jgi:hypothetical protein